MAKKDGTVTWDYTYNPDGLRLSRSNNTTTYNYVYNGSQLTAMTVGSNVLYFSYDTAGTPMSVNFNGTEYFYTSNIQGDVIGIVNDQGQTVVTYTYDPWGYISSITGSDAATLGAVNPLRYRGYVYDQESGLYYLQSRYYAPELGRFNNADVFTSTGQGLLGYNMFAYCLNNPVNMFDSSGYRPTLYGWYKNNIREPLKQAWNDLTEDVSNFDIYNTDINKVYNARFLSAYKGSLVIRHDISFLTSWGINGTIVLNHDLDHLTPDQKRDTLNHEYGHICQEQEMGRVKYFTAVFFPSAAYNVVSRFDSSLASHYYDMPWEHDADRRGNVNRGGKASWADVATVLYLKFWGEE